MNTPMWKAWLHRAAALLLSASILLSCLPVSARAEELPGKTAEDTAEDTAAEAAAQTPDDGALRVYVDGQEASGALLSSDSHLLLSARLEGREAQAWRWQIFAPGEGRWVDISGAESDTLQVGFAMVVNMLDGDGCALLRCRAYDGEVDRYSGVVQLLAERPETPQPEPAPAEVLLEALAAEAAQARAALEEAPEEPRPEEPSTAETLPEAEPETLPPAEDGQADALETARLEAEAAAQAAELAAQALTDAQVRMDTAEAEAQGAAALAEEAASRADEACQAAEEASAAQEAAPEDGEAADRAQAAWEEAIAAKEAFEAAVQAAEDAAARLLEAQSAFQSARDALTAAQAAASAAQAALEALEQAQMEAQAEAEPAPDAGEDQPEAAPLFVLEAAEPVVPMAEEGDGTSGGELVTHTVTLEYLYSNDAPAHQTVSAHIKPGESLHITQDCPTLVGYTPYILTVDGEITSDEVTKDTPNAQLAYATADGKETYGIPVNGSLTIDIKNVTRDYDYKVVFFPNRVSYTVNQNVQNVVNDDYFLHRVQVLEGYVDEMTRAPDLTKVDQAGEDYLGKGFISLEPFDNMRIAADGTTLVNTYYDREYFLMSFQLEGGRGVNPVFARYGTQVLVEAPVRTGYTFLGWAEVPTDESGRPIGEPDEKNLTMNLNRNMPAKNTIYRAVWEAAQTQYTVIYWQENPDDEGYSFWCSKEMEAKAEEKINANALTDPSSKGTGALNTYQRSYHYELVSNIPDNLDGQSFVLVSNRRAVQMLNFKISGNDIRLASSAFHENDASAATVEWTFESAGNGQYYIQSDGKYIYFNGLGGVTVTSSREAASKISVTRDGSLIMLSCGGFYINQWLGMSGPDTNGFGSHTDQDDKGNYLKLYRKIDDGLTETNNDDEMKFFYYDHNDVREDTVVNPDGTTIVNVYYKRKVYNLRFFYARQNDATGKIEVVGGTTYPFSENQLSAADQLLKKLEEWGEITALPEMAPGKTNLYSKGTLKNDDGYTYHYIEFQAKYMQEIADEWPSDVFKTATRSELATNTNNGISWSKETAVFSAWNGEYWLKYNRDEAKTSKPNYTIKGNYQQLDEKLLYDASFKEMPYYDMGTGNNHLDFIAFWENGAKIYWSIPMQFYYYLWVRDENQDTNGLPTSLPRNGEPIEPGTRYNIKGTVYKLYDIVDSCDNDTNAEKQTVPGISGYRYCGKNFAGSYGGYDGNTLYYANDDWNKDTYAASYTLNYLYEPVSYSITLHSHNHVQTIQNIPYGSMLGAETIKDQYNPKMETTYYPDDLPAGAYTFGGWYKTAGHLDGTEADFSKPMPNQNMILYAKWVPKRFNVRVWQTSDMQKLVYTSATDSLAWLTHTDSDGTVSGGLGYGDHLKTMPEAGPDKKLAQNLTASSPGGTGDIDAQWIFECWAYRDSSGREHALDTGSFTVSGDVDIYAKWTASEIVRYQVRYAQADLEVKAGDIFDPDGRKLEFQSDGTLRYEDRTPWTPAVKQENGRDVYIAADTAGRQNQGANRTFQAKTGADLYEDYRTGFYPLTASHTVLMDGNKAQDRDEDKTPIITYTFYYLEMDEVPYTVRYLDENNRALFPDKSGKNLTEENEKLSVVTENWIYRAGYTVDAVQKMLILSANPAENVITFHYTKSGKIPYTIYYYYETTDAVYDTQVNDRNYRKYSEYNLNLDIAANPDNRTVTVNTLPIEGHEYVFDTVQQFSDGTPNPDPTVNASRVADFQYVADKTELSDALDEKVTLKKTDGGYKLVCTSGHDHTLTSATIYYTVDGKKEEVRDIRWDQEKKQFKLTLYKPVSSFQVEIGDYGTVIRVYYDLKYYPYFVYHKVDGTGKLLDRETGKAPFQTRVPVQSWNEQKLIENRMPGYQVSTSNKEITMTITSTLTIQNDQNDQKINTVTFWYYEKTLDYKYVPMVVKDPGSEGQTRRVERLENDKNASVTLANQVVRVVSGNAEPSKPQYNPAAYRFLGWYLDEACTKPVAQDDTYYGYLGLSAKLDDTATGKDIAEKMALQPQKAEEDASYYYSLDGENDTNIQLTTPMYLSEYKNHAYEDSQTFYALYEPLLGELTIRREAKGPEKGHREADSFVYMVQQTQDVDGKPVENGVKLQVTIAPGEKSVTIGNLPFGKYTVTQENSWSWRYDDPPQTEVKLSQQNSYPTAVFQKTIVNKRWLSGFAEHVKNVFAPQGVFAPQA